MKYGLKLQEAAVNHPHTSHYGAQCDGGAGLTPAEQSYRMKPLDFDSVTFNITSHSLNGLQLNQ